MSPSDLHVIVGLGATGISCVRYLESLGIQQIAVNDTRANPPELSALEKNHPNVAKSLGKLDEALLDKAARIIISPGIAVRTPAIAKQIRKGTPVIGDIELFALNNKARVIAITGTNAKSTVTTLVGLMAERAKHNVGVGGNLGVPALELLIQNTHDLYVLELSSFQLETTFSLAPEVATVLNVSEDHMDRYDSLRDYQAAKLRIYHDCKNAVVNRDDALTECDGRTARKLYFTLNAPEDNTFGIMTDKQDTYLAFENEKLLHTGELPVLGKHYQANALASLAIGAAFGLPQAVMLQVLRDFKGLPHRCQFVRELNGVKWFNDSKGTNVGATLAAIEGLGQDMPGKMIWIAGGVGKNADFKPLKSAIQQYARHAVLLGEAANDIASAIGKVVPISFAVNLEDAINKARSFAEKNDYVLLSPACASYDMFKHFAHRGDVFMEVVKTL